MRFEKLEEKEALLKQVAIESDVGDGDDFDFNKVKCIKGTTDQKKRQIDQLIAEVEKLRKDKRVVEATMAGGYGESGSEPGSKARRGKADLGHWLKEGLEGGHKGWSDFTGANGGAFAPVGYSSAFFDHLHAASVGIASGFRVIPTDSKQLVFPRLLSDTAASWTDENAQITTSDATADEVTATPRKLATLQILSSEVVRDSDPQVLQVSAHQMVRSLGLALDLGFFEGSGTAPEIRGLKNTPGVQTVSMGTDGAAFTDLDPFAEAIGKLAEANANASAIVMHPRDWKALSQLKEQTSSSNKPLLQQSAGAGTQGVQRSIYGIPVLLSSQLSVTETMGTATNASTVFVYQADEIAVVMRRAPDVVSTPWSLFDYDQVAVRAILRADMVVPQAAAVCLIEGVIPPV